MTQLSWITPAGSIANFLIGLPASVVIQAAVENNLNSAVTYSVVHGTLPIGMTLSAEGIISGTPAYTSSTDNYFTTQDYKFVIRAKSGTEVVDRSFTIILTNIINQDFIWVTPEGSIGTIPNGSFYKFQLQAESLRGLRITYSFVSGELPYGIELIEADRYDATGNLSVAGGTLQGVPTFLNPIAVDQSQNYRFTIRATNSAGHIIDRTFNLSLTNVYGPVIRPTTTLLGAFFDGTFFNQQLTVQELNPNVQIQWQIKSGRLPPGITLSNTGLLSGYIMPVQLASAYGPAGYDGDIINNGIIVEQQEYDYGPFDFTVINQSQNFNFTIQAFDGANYDTQDYLVEIVSRSSWTADFSGNASVNDTYLTVDSSNVYLPVLLNSSTTLPTGRQGSYYAYKFDGYDFTNAVVTYSMTDTAGTFDADVFDPLTEGLSNNGLPGSFDIVTTSTNNLPGLTLDSQSGWLYGKINPQSAALQNYTFGITVSKVDNSVIYSSKSITFTLPVLGDVNNVIEWITPSNLGTIDNGSVSELRIQAKNLLGKELTYGIYDQAGKPARLPQGLKLLSTGLITGRVSFEAFAIDNYDTTFDGNKLTIDQVSIFTVQASTIDGTATSYQEFTLTLKIIDKKPYVNLYLKAMPAFDQRQLYKSVVNNKEIFPDSLIYRLDDPWFGVNKNIDMLFLPGLNTETLSAYEQAIIHNHWTKQYNFGDIKSAVVLDTNYQIKYEVVYIEIVDPKETTNSAGQTIGPAMQIDLTSVIANPYVDNAGEEYKIVYPNSSQNMKAELEQNIGYADQSSLPPWMVSNQLGSTSTTFNPPLGFTKAVVLAYTVAGAGKLIAYRLKNYGINFNNIEFSVNRYEVDNYYSTFFNPTTQKYIGGIETTFDVHPKNNIGNIVAHVDYAVNIPFSEINGRSIDYINSHGGLDGIIIDPFTASGQTIIFAKQENFLNAGPYNGWVDYADAFIGDNITTAVVEGYDSGSYDTYTVIPGYLEKEQGIAAVNKRGSVWQILLVGNTVSLINVLEITPYDCVQIKSGKTYGTAIMYYIKPDQAGQTVPYYTIFQIGKDAITSPTTFNNSTTKFFSNRDQYYTPNSQDKYLVFPQTGVFT